MFVQVFEKDFAGEEYFYHSVGRHLNALVLATPTATAAVAVAVAAAVAVAVAVTAGGVAVGVGGGGATQTKNRKPILFSKLFFHKNNFCRKLVTLFLGLLGQLLLLLLFKRSNYLSF